VIEQAKGVLVSARRMSPERAFAELHYVSKQHNVKLNHHLAAALVATVGGHQEVDPFRKIIEHEWGKIVPNC